MGAKVIITREKLEEFRKRVKEYQQSFSNMKLVNSNELLALVDFCEHELDRREEE